VVEFENIDEAKFAMSANDLVEIMAKRPRFAKSSKRQAATALQAAIHQKPVAMLDPWVGVKVVPVDCAEGRLVDLSDRWQNERAVVYLLRRFGCPLCLHQASMLMALKPALDEHGVRLIAVGNGDFAMAKQFKEGLNWPGEVYLDPDSTSYKAIHLKRLSNWEVAKRYFTSLRVLSWFKNNPHKAQNQDGDGFQTGGVFIVGPGAGSSVIFSFKEIDNDPLSFPIPEAILNACTADLKKHKRVTSGTTTQEVRDID
jgi:prostamide/prostaglandin F2alpha synthase